MTTMRVLVTGGAGFIGSHVCERLLARGHRVRVIDDLSTGRRENLPADTEFLHATITDPANWDAALADVDAVVHLAAVASVQKSTEAPLATNDVNLRATIGLADAMATRGIHRVAYASSAAVYGLVERERHRADDPPAPITPYGIDKLAGEHYLAFFHAQRGLEPRILRFFNVYGPRQDPASPYSGVISIFTERLLNGTTAYLYGDGEQTRDFIYVGDVADTVVHHLEDDRDLRPTPMNVCTGRATSLLDLIAALEDVTGRRTQVAHAPARDGDIRHSLGMPDGPDGAFTELRSGLAATVAWVKASRA